MRIALFFILIFSFSCRPVEKSDEVSYSVESESLDIQKVEADTKNSEKDQDDQSLSADAVEDDPSFEGDWIKVPGNNFLGVKAFYVMAYEARAIRENDEIEESGKNISNRDHRPFSSKNGLPWRFITESEAFDECRSLGERFNLISNKEWMALAHDISDQDENWTGGAVDLGCLFRGNSGEYPYVTKEKPHIDCGYASNWDKEESTYVVDGVDPNKRSIYTLSNGEKIYNFSGNVYEWVSWSQSYLEYTYPPDTFDCGHGDFKNLVETRKEKTQCAQIQLNEFQPKTLDYDYHDGIGRYYSAYDRGRSPAVRGGHYSGNIDNGPYGLSFWYGKGTRSDYIGFRCVYRP